MEIGWLLEGDLPVEQRNAAKEAAAEMQRTLADLLPGFHWVIETIERPGTTERGPVEPVRLLDAAEIDRHQRGWDFVFVVTRRELRGRERQRVLGVTAGIFASALVSTAFLSDPASEQKPLGARLHTLTMHVFGRLNGLAPDDAPTWMRPVENPDDLDEMEGYAPPAANALSARMEEVADLRVEETEDAGKGWLRFYARSLWQNRGALPGVIARMRPWSFPLRLHRLMTAAGSALAVLIMTAESWEVAANLSAAKIAILSLAAILGTSGYLIRAQHLLASRRGPLREQRAVSNAGITAAVVAGMAVTYAGILALASVFAAGLFGDDLIVAWTGVSDTAAVSVRARLAALAACLSVVIGALGAAFEPYGYFRHVTQIDDEI
ncbi:hypothetical protein Salmuc_03860 [Salipiger mucosus DSM 16094]|uniref:Uncharacterized protein n=1 Tax=Salipiger mucosus DSM 16094 TaxID=1123237 RepID=S9QLT6_9RHOB|nr:hypothetical protein Salmuc_03860 [Salipiger mucosus DSM 16094]